MNSLEFITNWEKLLSNFLTALQNRGAEKKDIKWVRELLPQDTPQWGITPLGKPSNGITLPATVIQFWLDYKSKICASWKNFLVPANLLYELSKGGEHFYFF